MSKLPRYVNSWKGQVLKALIVDKEVSWSELQQVTGLAKSPLNTALSELLKLKIITKHAKGYYVQDQGLKQDYLQYYSLLPDPPKPSQPQPTSKVRDIKHAQIVEYVIKKPLLNNTPYVETEYRTNYFYSGRYIDVLKWTVERNRYLIAVFEVKPKIDDIGNTIRQVKDYCHHMKDVKDPTFGHIKNKHIISYLVVDATVHNYAIFHDFRHTFKKSGLDFMMFVDVTRNEDMLIHAKNFQFEHLDRLSKWVRRD